MNSFSDDNPSINEEDEMNYNNNPEYEEGSGEESDNHPRNRQNEEDALKENLEEIEFEKIINAKTKLQYENRLNIHRGKKDKKTLSQKYEKVNTEKSKAEPKEFSALVRPKKQQINTLNIKKELRRDPRFDDMSGKINPDRFNANYSFVQDMAHKYVNDLDKLKQKKKKNKNKLSEDKYDLLKKQINFVKGWVKSKEYENTKESINKEIKGENKERVKIGKNPLYLKKNQIKQLVSTSQMEKRTEKDMKRFLKKKQHRDIVKNRKQEGELNIK